MKVERTIYIPKTIEVEAQYVVVIRTSGYSGMGCYSQAGDWHWLALCGDNKELAKSKKKQAIHDYSWVDVDIKLLTDEEISQLLKWQNN